MASPRICFVGFDTLPILAREYNQFGAGGEQVQQTLLAKEFAARGFDVSMIVSDYGQADGAVWHGVKTYKAAAAREGLPILGYYHPRLTRFWSALRRADADVYYFSRAAHSLGVLAYFARRRSKRVVFRVAHDSDCNPDELLIRFRRDKQLYKYGLRRADSILVQSQQQAAALRRNFGLNGEIARMLVEPAVRDLPYGSRDVDVLWVNNFRPFKRPDLMLALARRLEHQSCEMVGGALHQHADLFKQMEEEARGIDNLVMRGAVPYHDVNELYEQAKVFVNTSDSEGFPNSYLQAWARGTPVVSFFDPDGEMEREGLGIAVRDLTEMADAVRELAGSEASWQEYSSRCKAYMERNFNSDDVLQPYMRAFGLPSG